MLLLLVIFSVPMVKMHPIRLHESVNIAKLSPAAAGALLSLAKTTNSPNVLYFKSRDSQCWVYLNLGIPYMVHLKRRAVISLKESLIQLRPTSISPLSKHRTFSDTP